MITREEVYKHLYHKKLHELNDIQRHDKLWTDKLKVDEYYLSRKANIYAVKFTDRYWQSVRNLEYASQLEKVEI